MFKSAQKGFTTILIAIVALFLAVVIILYFLIFQKNSQRLNQTINIPTPITQVFRNPGKNEGDTKTYQSKNLKISFTQPIAAEISENLGSLIVSNNQGRINILQNSSNYETLIDYIKYSENNLETRISDKQELRINNLSAVSGLIDNEKIYLIYADYTVYIISTSSPELYDDLDQIAQSFKYTPKFP